MTAPRPRVEHDVHRGRPHTGNNRAINVIRTLAALTVIVGHVRVLFFENYGAAPPSAARALGYAVTSLGPGAGSVFFVLSGYWVGGSALVKVRSGTFTWRGYGSSRLIRLWLVLLPALVLTLGADRLGLLLRPRAPVYLDGGTYAEALGHVSWSPLDFLGNAFFAQSIFVDPFGTDKALWSLANEFWYYLVFPAALIAVTRSGYSARARWVAAVLAVGGMAVAGPTVLALFPAWLAGAAVASRRETFARIIGRSGGTALRLARVATMVATLGAMITTKLVAIPTLLGGLLIAAPAALLVGLLVVDVRATSGSGARALDAGSWLAGSSYSLYVIHMPLAVLFTALVIPDAAARWTFDAVHIAYGLGIVGVLVLAAAGFAEVTERRTEIVRVAFRAVGARTRWA